MLRNINAFTLGAQSVNPKITTQAIFTGDWSLPVKEAEATNSLIAQGVDVVTCHVDSPKVVVETAERAGIFTCGYHCNQAKLAPKGYLTGAEWNWEQVYVDYRRGDEGGRGAGQLRARRPEGRLRPDLGLRPGGVGRRRKDEGRRGRRRAMLTGSFAIFKGALKDNKGNTSSRRARLHADRAQLESMNYLVEGVVGATS